MATYTPEQYQIFNELDEMGLLLDLPRLAGENNTTYKQRLFDVFVHRADSTYRGLINGITRELGLESFHAMTISPVWAGDGYSAPNPAVVFDETKCYVYADYVNDPANATIDRYEKTGSWTLGELVQSINDTGYLYAALQPGVSSSGRAMQVFNQSSIDLVIAESLAKGSTVINLDNQNLLSNSVSISSTNLRERVSTQTALVKAGQYYIDYTYGIIYTVQAPEPGAIIRYEYRNDNFEVWASPVIIHNLQSSDFKKKMFEQILTSDNTYTNGAPTAIGADLVNELLAVAGLGWGS